MGASSRTSGPSCITNLAFLCRHTPINGQRSWNNVEWTIFSTPARAKKLV